MEKKNLKWRILVIAGVMGLSIWSLYPVSEKIHLGLDLSGGIHLVLQVETDDAIKADLDNLSQRFISGVAEDGITLESADVDRAAALFRIDIPADADSEVLNDMASRLRLGVEPGQPTWTFKLAPNEPAKIRDQAVRQCLETIWNRVDQFGVAEPVIQRQGQNSNRILVQLPGVDDPERVKDLIQKTAYLEFKEVLHGPAGSREILTSMAGGTLPRDGEVLQGKQHDIDGEETGKQYYLVRKAAIIAGRELRSARRDQDNLGQPVVQFETVPAARDKFTDFTASHIGTAMAVVLDGNVISAPVIRSRIPGQGHIEGNFTIEKAEDLALKLRAGAMPGKIIFLEERTVGPSLGRDSVNRGITAAAWGLAVVLVFMLFYYRLSGLNANLALVLNLIILLGAMAYFKATLTLPGIAGVILTIGMAVDANVLIFERIREELRALGPVGSVGSAIKTGFSRAFGTILDANITTLIAALFLFQFGTGPIKGFAVTLSIGIMASVFTAVFVSRTLYMVIVRERAQAGLSI